MLTFDKVAVCGAEKCLTCGMLEYFKVNKSFGNLKALEDFSLFIPKGETHALIGSSGSGKSTLLRATMGLINPETGKITLNDEMVPNVLDLPAQTVWAKKIGYVPQDGGLFPHLKVRKNVSIVATSLKWSEEKISARIDELAEAIHLPRETLEKFPHQISGGQRQRAALLRAAFLDPFLMILDEPFGAMDPILRYDLQAELRAIFLRLNKTVLLVTHDFNEAVYFSNRMTLLHGGKIVQTGTLMDFKNNPTQPIVTRFMQAQRKWENSDLL